ncbi:MAG: lytic transglycosylase domain-containing protein [Acidimicrobiia bacterium]
MLKHIKAAVVPVVLVAAIAGAAGYRAQDSGSGRRLDELSKERPAAATHFPVDGALVAASQAADEARWVEAFNAHQAELFYQAVAAAEAERAAEAAAAANARKKAVAPTGRGGGGGGSSVGGSCGGATNGADRFIGAESGGNPNARNSSGAWGCYQIMPGTWQSSCSDLGQHGSASTDAQAQCASRLPSSSWSATGG